MTGMIGVYARDAEGNIKKKKPCQTPGCKWPNWHVCLVGKPDTFPDLVATLFRRSQGQQRFGPRSDAHKEAISAAQQERWSRVNGARDRQMAAYYMENQVGHKDVAKHFGVAPSTALKALKRGEKAGIVKMRKRGQTLQFSARHNHN